MNLLGSSHYVCSLNVGPENKLYHVVWATNPDDLPTSPSSDSFHQYFRDIDNQKQHELVWLHFFKNYEN